MAERVRKSAAPAKRGPGRPKKVKEVEEAKPEPRTETIRVGESVMELVTSYAELQEIENNEAADDLIATGFSRKKALAKHAKVLAARAKAEGKPAPKKRNRKAAAKAEAKAPVRRRRRKAAEVDEAAEEAKAEAVADAVAEEVSASSNGAQEKVETPAPEVVAEAAETKTETTATP